MKTNTAILTGTLIGAALAGLGMAAWLHAGKGPETAGTPAPLSGLASEDAVAAARQPIPTAVTSQASQVPPAMLDAEQLEAVSLRASREATAKHEAQWAADTAEPVQAAALEQKALAAAQADMVVEARYQPSEFHAACKSSMCRIETKFPAGTDGNDWATRLLLQMGGTFGASSSVATPQPNGGSSLVVYVYRLGREPRG